MIEKEIDSGYPANVSNTRYRKRLYLLTASAMMIVLVIGATLTVYTARTVTVRMQTSLLNETRMARNVVNWRRIQVLTGGEADLTSPDYMRLKEQLTLMNAALPYCRFIYLLGRKPDGTIYFLVDSEPPGSPDYSPPGQVFEEVSDACKQVFSTGREITEGPVADRWGTWVSGLAPITDPETGACFAVLGIDVNAGDWNRQVIEYCMLPILTTVSLTIVLFAFAFFMMYQRVRREKRLIEDSETALRLSEERFRKLFHKHSAVKIVLDPDTGRIIDANEAATDYYGWSIDQLKQMSIQQINTLPPDAVKAEMEKAKSQKRIRFEFRHRRADGSVRDVEVFSNVIDLAGKDLLYSIIHDITDRKLAEKKLRETSQKWEAIISASPDGIGIVALDGKVQLISDKLATMYGYSVEEKAELLGRTIFEFIDPQDHQKLKENLGNLLAGEKALKYSEYIAINKDGSRFDVEVNSSVQYDPNGNPISILFVERDVTERKQAEQSLKKAFDQIKTLRGIVPICANCKKIRDDKGYWEQVDVYVRDHTEAQFSHGICPDCMTLLYPGHKPNNDQNNK